MILNQVRDNLMQSSWMKKFHSLDYILTRRPKGGGDTSKSLLKNDCDESCILHNFEALSVSARRHYARRGIAGPG